MAAQLMAAGANQQLIASELDKTGVAEPEAKANDEEKVESSDGSLKIEHEGDEEAEAEKENKEISIDEHGNLKLGGEEESKDKEGGEGLPPALEDATLREIEKGVDSPHIVNDPTSTLNEIEEAVDSPHVEEAKVEQPQPETKPVLEPVQVEAQDAPVSTNSVGTDYIETPRPKELVLPPLAPADRPQAPVLEPMAPEVNEDNVAETEAEAASEETKEEQVEDAREAVMDAINSAPYDADRPEPVAALNATPVDLAAPAPVADTLVPSLDADPSPATEALESNDSKDMFAPVDKVEPAKLDNATDDISEQTPPPVPPPMMPLN